MRIRATIARDSYARMQRTVDIRQASGDRVVAMIEVLSAGNKPSRHAIRSLLDKAIVALDNGFTYSLSTYIRRSRGVRAAFMVRS